LSASINTLRARQKRNMIATLLFSQGVPMLLAGDELGRTQRGNNNAYCQDNELSWVNWELSAEDRQFLAFVRRAIALRKAHPVFRRRSFFQGRSIRGTGVKDLFWVTPEGTEMTDEEWTQHFARCLGVLLSGQEINERGPRGEIIRDDNCLLLINAHHEAIPFRLPETTPSTTWHTELDTHHKGGLQSNGKFRSGDIYRLAGRTLALLIQRSKA
jgi:glycogen operon protein